jgi:UDP-N-acetyl-D-mannosaminuronate dehydrogenase
MSGVEKKGVKTAGAAKVINGSKVLIMGLPYKENVPDTRESPVKGMVRELKEFGVDAKVDRDGGIISGELGILRLWGRDASLA